MKATSLLALLLTAVLAAGCGNQDTGTTGISNSAVSTAQAAEIVPSTSDVQAKLGLDTEQSARMDAALTQWRHGTEPAAGGLAAGWCVARPRELAEFLESSSEFLDTEQFVKLVQLIQERVEARQAEAKATGERGRFGRAGSGPNAVGAGRAGRGAGVGVGRGPQPEGIARRGGPGFGAGDAPLGLDVETLTEDLGLSEEQAAKLTDYFTEHRQEMRDQMREARQTGDFDPQAWWEQRKAQRDAVQEFLASELTPEQLDKLEQLREERQEERFAARQEQMEARFTRRAELLTKVLSLDETQQAKLTELFQARQEQQKEHFENRAGQDLTPQEHQQMREENRAELTASIRAILNEDQQVRFDALESLAEACPRGARGPHGGPGPRRGR
jgi:Spy/CpxP family protein refolding chaperone